MDAARELAQLFGGLRELLPEALEVGDGLGRVALEPPTREPDVERHRHEPLLGAVVQVALDPPPGGVGGLDDPHARCAQLLGPGVLDLLDAQRLLGPAALRHVEERAVDPRAARAAHDMAAVEDPAHLAVGADDPVLEGEGAGVLRGLLDDVLDALEVVRVHDAQQRAPRAGEERRRRMAGDPLDLVADELDDVPGVPGGPVDGARHVQQERADERVVGAVAGRGEAGPGAREELAATERPLEVVVGTRATGRRRARRGRSPAARSPPCGRRGGSPGTRRRRRGPRARRRPRRAGPRCHGPSPPGRRRRRRPRALHDRLRAATAAPPARPRRRRAPWRVAAGLTPRATRTDHATAIHGSLIERSSSGRTLGPCPPPTSTIRSRPIAIRARSAPSSRPSFSSSSRR